MNKHAALALLLTATAAGGCGAEGDPAGTASAGGGDGGAGAQGGGGAGGSGDVTVGTGSGGGTGCDVHCSADLHDVLDCNNQVVMTCPDTLGCGPNGTCIDPCASAEANESTIGCDFYSVVPGPETSTRGSCFAALLANTWTTPVTLQAEYGGQALDIAAIARTPSGSGPGLTYQPLAGGVLPPGEIAILFLAQAPGGGSHFLPCPAGVTAGISADTSVTGTGLLQAFRITTSAPVVAYDMYPYGGAQSYVSSATLLVPTAAWGTNYVAADAFAEDPAIAFAGGKPFVQVVARADDTHVTISPTAAIVGGGGVAGTGAGQPVTYTLAQGQALQLLQDAELAGSPLDADKPVGVWGGSGCMNIPIGKYACDSGHQQNLPVKALGHEYVAVRYRNRVAEEETVPWTLIGAVDGTALSYDPAPPPGAPATLAGGQVVRFDASAPFVVRSQDDQHPFSMAGHMTGWTALVNNPGGAGDAEYVITIPPQQYLNHYLFLTDPTYANTHLVLTRRKAADGTFKDVTLGCAGTLGGWQPVGGGAYEYARFDLVKDGTPQGGCGNGVHVADSEEPFGLTVWGWDFAVSYAYPAGMSTQPINTVVVPPVPR